MINHKKVGLALSGGGFRAAAFHLGTLKKLYELNILNGVDIISTISGGSIVGAFYTLNKDNFDDFLKRFREILKKNLILRACFTFRFLIRALLILASIMVVALLTTSWSWTIIYILVAAIVVAAFFYKIFPTTRLIKKLYDTLIYDRKLLKDIPEYPKLVINSTNLDTGTLFSYTRDKSFDSSYYFIYNEDFEFDTRDFTIAKAVACSTAVPYAFSPTVLKFRKGKITVYPKLVDGRVYDNQGIHRIVTSQYKTDIVIVSDASAPFKKRFFGINPLPVLSRIMNVMMNRIKNLQFAQSIYGDNEDELYEIGYFSLEWEYEKCLNGFCNGVMKNKLRPHLLKAHNITEEMKKDRNMLMAYLKKSIGFEEIIKNGLSHEQIEFVKNISTSLRNLTEEEIGLLGKHAETLTEIQVKLYCPTVVN